MTFEFHDFDKQGDEVAAADVHFLDAQLKRSILRRRAVQLARPIEKPDVPPGAQYVVFLLSNQKFACDVRFVDEVFQVKSVLPIPGTPQYIVGLSSLRGTLIAIVDLKHLCNLHEKAVMGSDKTLILRNDDLRIGVMTDDVVGLDYIADVELQNDSPLVLHIPSQFVNGITSSGIIVLNCDTLFSMEALEVNE